MTVHSGVIDRVCEDRQGPRVERYLRLVEQYERLTRLRLGEQRSQEQQHLHVAVGYTGRFNVSAPSSLNKIAIDRPRSRLVWHYALERGKAFSHITHNRFESAVGASLVMHVSQNGERIQAVVFEPGLVADFGPKPFKSRQIERSTVMKMHDVQQAVECRCLG